MTESGVALTDLSSKLSRLSSGKVVLAAAALFVLFMVLVLPRQAEVSSRQLAGVGSPDMSFIYSAEEIYAWAEAYGADGREAYIRARWTFDLVWPIVYGFFLVTASIVMLQYPNETLIAASLASPATVAKWVCVGGSFVSLFVGILVWIWRFLRGRRLLA